MLSRSANEALPYEALLLDVDGTIVDDEGRVPPRLVARLRALAEEGVRVMLATGRSETSVQPVIEQLALDGPCIVYNGAALYCPSSGRLLEERLLSNRTTARALAFGQERGYLTLVQRAGAKYASPPADDVQRRALEGLTALHVLDAWPLPADLVIRITLFSERHACSSELLREIESAIRDPFYGLHFPLGLLAKHRDSRMQVADVHPPCLGKGEALRVLEESFGIPPERVVAVGDATNDIPMFLRAGLGVAMADGMEEARRAADRVLPTTGPEGIIALIDEVFRQPAARRRASESAAG